MDREPTPPPKPKEKLPPGEAAEFTAYDHRYIELMNDARIGCVRRKLLINCEVLIIRQAKKTHDDAKKIHEALAAGYDSIRSLHEILRYIRSSSHGAVLATCKFDSRDVLEEDIAALAEALWNEQGRPHTSANSDWVAAEKGLTTEDLEVPIGAGLYEFENSRGGERILTVSALTVHPELRELPEVPIGSMILGKILRNPTRWTTAEALVGTENTSTNGYFRSNGFLARGVERSPEENESIFGVWMRRDRDEGKS